MHTRVVVMKQLLEFPDFREAYLKAVGIFHTYAEAKEFVEKREGEWLNSHKYSTRQGPSFVRYLLYPTKYLSKTL